MFSRFKAKFMISCRWVLFGGCPCWTIACLFVLNSVGNENELVFFLFVLSCSFVNWDLKLLGWADHLFPGMICVEFSMKTILCLNSKATFKTDSSRCSHILQVTCVTLMVEWFAATKVVKLRKYHRNKLQNKLELHFFSCNEVLITKSNQLNFTVVTRSGMPFDNLLRWLAAWCVVLIAGKRFECWKIRSL